MYEAEECNATKKGLRKLDGRHVVCNRSNMREMRWVILTTNVVSPAAIHLLRRCHDNSGSKFWLIV